MKRLALSILFFGMSAAMVHASSVTLSLHTTTDTPIIDLSTILNQWGTPSATDSIFTILGTGTDKIGGLNLVNDTGIAITSLAVYAYGTIGSNVYNASCVNDSGSPFTSCTAPGTVAANTTIPISSPISWVYSGGGSIAADITKEFRLVDTATGTNTNLFYEIEINGNPPSSPVPEPSSVIGMSTGLLALGLLAAFRHKALLVLYVPVPAFRSHGPDSPAPAFHPGQAKSPTNSRASL